DWQVRTDLPWESFLFRGKRQAQVHGRTSRCPGRDSFSSRSACTHQTHAREASSLSPVAYGIMLKSVFFEAAVEGAAAEAELVGGATGVAVAARERALDEVSLDLLQAHVLE